MLALAQIARVPAAQHTHSDVKTGPATRNRSYRIARDLLRARTRAGSLHARCCGLSDRPRGSPQLPRIEQDEGAEHLRCPTSDTLLLRLACREHAGATTDDGFDAAAPRSSRRPSRARPHGWFGNESPTATGTPHFRHSSTAACRRTNPALRRCCSPRQRPPCRSRGDDAARTSSTMKI